jgi:isoleucyl-tRNA synthetase
VMDKFGADILRLWVVASDYSEDLRIGQEIIGHSVDTYRRLRNTLRYLLGSLEGFSETERVDYWDMPELERWVLSRLYTLDRMLVAAADDYDFHRFYTELHTFCAVDLSAFYFDVRKDSVYCDPPDSIRRRAARTVLDHIFNCLTAWLAPVLCFTAEEAWLARHPPDHPLGLERSQSVRALGGSSRCSPGRDRSAGIGARGKAHRLIPPGPSHGLRAVGDAGRIRRVGPG